MTNSKEEMVIEISTGRLHCYIDFCISNSIMQKQSNALNNKIDQPIIGHPGASVVEEE